MWRERCWAAATSAIVGALVTKTADDPTEVVICPRCNATYSEGEAHECVPQPGGSGPNAVGWSFQLVTGVVIGLVGGLGARFWYTLVRSDDFCLGNWWALVDSNH